MIIKNKDKGQDEAGAAPNAPPGQENQARDAPNQESFKAKDFPLDDELQYKFYHVLPDYSTHIISESEGQELMKRERLESEELLAIEIKKLQQVQEEQEKNGQEPDPLPDEAELKEKIAQQRQTRGINQWKDDKFDEFIRKMQKS